MPTTREALHEQHAPCSNREECIEKAVPKIGNSSYKIWYAANKERLRAKRNNPEFKARQKEANRKWREVPGNKERIRSRLLEPAVRDRNKQIQDARNRSAEYRAMKNEWRKKPENVVKQQVYEKRRSAVPEIRERRRVRKKERIATDVEYRLSQNLRCRLSTAVKKFIQAARVSAVSDLGCSLPELIQHLEGLFRPGMSWSNYGNKDGQWNIDHIRPLTRFLLSDPEQLRRAVHYTNLQPLWAIDNLKKSAKWEEEDGAP